MLHVPSSSSNSAPSSPPPSSRYAQAEAKFREALAEAQLGFEPHDPHIASAKNNLAEFYRNTGQWGKAEELYKEVRGAQGQRRGADSANRDTARVRLQLVHWGSGCASGVEGDCRRWAGHRGSARSWQRHLAGARRAAYTRSTLKLPKLV